MGYGGSAPAGVWLLSPVKKLLPAIGVLFAAAAQASAQLVYEPFDYISASLDGQTNPGNGLSWSKMSADPDNDDNILINNSNLGWPGIAPASGRSVTFAGAGASERLSLGKEFNSGTLYYSLVFQVTSPMTTTPAFIGGFSNGAGESGAQPQSVGARLYLKQGPGSTPGAPTFSVGISKNSSNPLEIEYDGEFALNTPVMVVGSYTINGTTFGTDDEARLWVNPSPSDFGAAVAPAPTKVAPVAGTDLPGPNGTALSGFVLRQVAAAPSVQVDELRMDRTWAQVTPPVGISWNVDASGTWSEDAKWSTATRPNAAGAFVNFGSVAQGARTVSVDSAYALRTINFTGNGPYTLDGAGTLNFSGSAGVNVMAGSHTISTAMTLGGDMVASVRSGSTLTLSSVTSNGNSLMKAGAGTLRLTNARFNNLEVIGGRVSVVANGSLDAVGKVNGLSVSSTTTAGVTTYNATLDLANNDLVIDYAPGQSPLGTWNGTAYTGILGALQSGRNGGAWNGAGIITSMSAAVSGNPRTTLGVAEASAALGLNATTTAWRGQLVDASSLLIKYTYAGDANLDGRIDVDDYFVIDSNYSKSGTLFGYGNGDFDYDGSIDADDYFLIDSNFSSQGLPLQPAAYLSRGISSVPEPGAFAVIAIAYAGSFLRRRRLR